MWLCLPSKPRDQSISGLVCRLDNKQPRFKTFLEESPWEGGVQVELALADGSLKEAPLEGFKTVKPIVLTAK